MKHGAVQNKLFMGLLSILLLIILYVIRDFLYPIFWAVVFTIMFVPVVDFFQLKFKIKRRFATVLMIILFIIFLFIPLVFAGSIVVQESIEIQQTYLSDNDRLIDEIDIFTQSVETRLGLADGYITVQVKEVFAEASNFLTSKIVSWGQNIISLTFSFFIALYIAYFLVVHNTSLKKRLIKLLPFGDDREKELISRFSNTTRATIKGTLLIILALAVVSYIFFAVLGIQGAALWASVLAVASIVPLVGTALIWVPMGIILLLLGSIGKGIAVLVFGVVIISNLDNVLRPLIVGKDTGLPEVVVLLSTLGGLATFGLTGLILGPVVATFVMVMLEMYEKEYEEFLSTEE